MLLLLAACGFDQYLEPVDDGSAPGRRDPPALDALAPYRNEATFDVTGLIAPGDTDIVVTVEGADPVQATIDGDAFVATVTVPRGVEASITATNDNGDSAPVTTTACDPWDAWEIDPAQDGDSCDGAVVISEQLLDAEDSERVVGNVLAEGDVDWYFVHTVDESVVENSAGFENYKFAARLVVGADRYEMTVFKGSCDSPECPEQGAYTEYDFFASDKEPDDEGKTPPDPRMCGDAPLNPCEDFSESYWIKVQRVDDALDCAHYELLLENGVW